MPNDNVLAISSSRELEAVFLALDGRMENFADSRHEYDDWPDTPDYQDCLLARDLIGRPEKFPILIQLPLQCAVQAAIALEITADLDDPVTLSAECKTILDNSSLPEA